jgi:hypothetical protein
MWPTLACTIPPRLQRLSVLSEAVVGRCRQAQSPVTLLSSNTHPSINFCLFVDCCELTHPHHMLIVIYSPPCCQPG